MIPDAVAARRLELVGSWHFCDLRRVDRRVRVGIGSERTLNAALRFQGAPEPTSANLTTELDGIHARSKNTSIQCKFLRIMDRVAWSAD